jgi:hypothetical protein
MKELENSKETHQIFVGNTDCNISITSGSKVTVKGNGISSAKGLVWIG